MKRWQLLAKFIAEDAIQFGTIYPGNGPASPYRWDTAYGRANPSHHAWMIPTVRLWNAMGFPAETTDQSSAVDRDIDHHAIRIELRPDELDQIVYIRSAEPFQSGYEVRNVINEYRVAFKDHPGLEQIFEAELERTARRIIEWKLNDEQEKARQTHITLRLAREIRG